MTVFRFAMNIYKINTFKTYLCHTRGREKITWRKQCNEPPHMYMDEIYSPRPWMLHVPYITDMILTLGPATMYEKCGDEPFRAGEIRFSNRR